MTKNTRPIQFLDYLPEVFRADEVNGISFLSGFLKAFEARFEELEGEIEGTPDRTSGGIPDLFDLDTTPPPQFAHRPQPDFDYLNYLASWIALPLRADLIRREGETDVDYDARRTLFNRQFFKIAIALHSQRSTLPGIEALLRAWLKGELQEDALIMTDLTRSHTDVDAVFQLGDTATLGVDTVLGEGPPFFFIADLIANPTVPELRNPVGLDVFQRAARFLLDAEKPAHTYYQLRIRTHTMQLPEPGQTMIDGRPGAQIGETTLLWEESLVFDSDC
jgi:phage tail-like protein